MIDETQDIIDSRDVIERISELETIRDDWQDWLDALAVAEEDGDTLDSDDAPEEFDSDMMCELCELQALENDCNYGDWQHGESLISDSYIETYLQDMVDDCYEIPELPSFMSVSIDFDALKMDYTEVEFRGQTFFIRC